MRIADQIFKNEIAQVAHFYSRSVITEIVQAHQSRFDYIIRALTAPRPVQTAIRDAAIADTGESLFPQQLAAILTVWLSPQFTGMAHTTSLDVPTFLPTSIGQPAGTIIVEPNGFPTVGTFRIQSSRGEQIIRYTGKTNTSFTGCTGGNGASAGQGNVITEVPDYDISPSAVKARRDAFVAAFTRRSQNAIGALNFINSKHIWSWKPPLAE